MQRDENVMKERRNDMNRKENLLRAIKREQPEWVPNGMKDIVCVIPPVVERPIAAGFDDWGVKYGFEKEAEGGTYPLTHGNVIHDIETWREEIKVPDLDALDWTDLTQTWARLPLDVAAIDRENTVVMGMVEFGIFERIYMLFGMEEALMYFLTDIDEMKEIAKIVADYKIKLITKFNDAIKLDVVWYGDDWGTQTNLFLPPDIWRKVIKPETKRIYDCMHDLGIIVNQHSCGKIEKIFGDIVENGADMVNPCQPCNDLKMLKSKYGDRISFFGGLDSQFVLNKPGVTAEEVRAEVRKRVGEMKLGGGYVAAPSHEVPYTKEVLDAMDDELNKVGKY